MPTMMMLKSAAFTSHAIDDGDEVELEVRWASNVASTLWLHYDPGRFQLSRDRLSLPVDANGRQLFTLTVAKRGPDRHCDVDFQLGDQHDQDSLEVT